jgi:alanine racemase
MKVDTGMGRLGVYADEAFNLARFALEMGVLKSTGYIATWLWWTKGIFRKPHNRQLFLQR